MSAAVARRQHEHVARAVARARMVAPVEEAGSPRLGSPRLGAPAPRPSELEGGTEGPAVRGRPSEGSAGPAPSECSLSRRLSVENSASGHFPQRLSIASVQTINSMYSKGSLTSDDVRTLEMGGAARLNLAGLLYHLRTEAALAAGVLANFVLINLMADFTAQGHPPPAWMDALNWAFLAATSGEMLLRCYVERSRAFRSGWHCMDAVVLCLSIAAEAAVLLIGSGLLLASVFRVLRVSRLLRFLHTLERLSFFRQLRKLIQMFASCLQTLFWSFCLTLLVMTMWANVAVVLLHPLVAELQSQGAWPDCQSCGRSFASVMRANLTLFQIIVASDSWGEVAVPLIETHPWTAVVFVGALWTLIFGMLNLMVAVVVDTFAEARENDLKDRSRELAQLEAREREALDRIFRRIDQGDTGCVTFADLRRGAEAVPEFKQRLRVMDVGLRDLQQLFSMIDEDSSGVIESHEFVEVLYRLKQTDPSVATVFLKHYVMDVKKKQVRMERKMRDIDTSLATLRDLLCAGAPGVTVLPAAGDPLRRRKNGSTLSRSSDLSMASSCCSLDVVGSEECALEGSPDSVSPREAIRQPTPRRTLPRSHLQSL